MSEWQYDKGSFQGFWYLRNGMIVELIEGEEHLEYFLHNYKEFGVTDQEIEDICNARGITLDWELHHFMEMTEREVDFLCLALKKGNLRVRLYDCFRDPYISIEYYGQRNKKYVCNCLIDMEGEYFSKVHLPYYFYDYESDSGIDIKSIDKAIVEFA